MESRGEHRGEESRERGGSDDLLERHRAVAEWQCDSRLAWLNSTEKHFLSGRLTASCLVAGKARRVPRVMEEFVNEVHVERRRALHERKQQPLIERQDIKRKQAQQRDTGDLPVLDENSDCPFHESLRFLNL